MSGPESAHAPLADHLARDFGGAFDVVAGAGGDVVQENFLGGATAHQDGELRFEEFLGVSVLVVDRQLHGDAESHAARDDGDFVQRVGAGSHGRDESVAGFVISGVPLFLVRQDHGLALDAHEDFVLGHFEIRHGDEFAVLARGPERGFVHEVGEIGAGKARRAAGDHGEIHVVGERAPCECARGESLRGLLRPDAEQRRGDRNGRDAASAGSRTSGRLVAAMRMTPSLDSKPSISTSKALRVCSRSS